MPRAAAVLALHGADLTISAAVDAFLTQADLADTTRREYGKHLARLSGRLGAERPLATLTASELEAAVTDLWGAGKPRTWNQRLAVVGSFLAFARRRGWAVGDLALGLDRRRVKVDRTRVPTPAALERFWARPGVPLLVKVFTRLQYETAARATELLSADIADLDMENRRLRVTSKGGDVEWVYFQSGAARILPRLLRGRSSGPLFVTDLRADARLPQGTAVALGCHGLRRRRVAGQVPAQKSAIAGALRERPQRACRGDHRRDRPEPTPRAWRPTQPPLRLAPMVVPLTTLAPAGQPHQRRQPHGLGTRLGQAAQMLGSLAAARKRWPGGNARPKRVGPQQH
jgi:integrase